MIGTSRIRRPARSIERRRGDIWPIRVEITDEDGVPVNDTVTTIKFVVDKSRYAAPDSTSFELESTGAYFYEVRLAGDVGAKGMAANEAYTAL